MQRGNRRRLPETNGLLASPFSPASQMPVMHPELKEILQRFGQMHLQDYFDQLSPAEAGSLMEQLANTNFGELAQLFESFGKPHQWTTLAARAEPPPAIRLDESPGQTPTRDDARQRGEAALAAGHIGLIIVAGGQGTRLGFEHPKGMLPVGPLSGRTLFQIHIDKLRAINERYRATVPLLVMTSPATDAETRTWLDQHDWFGYPDTHRTIFCQGTMPAVDASTGQILLNDRARLFKSPDGHGGMLDALQKSGCLAELGQRGIRQVFYCQVDNPLCQICDPATIGYHLLSGSEMTSQAIPKTDPLQKVGNLVSIDGKIQIIEYSDLPDEVACQTNADGSLKLWAGSIAVHVMDVAFLQRMSRVNALPFHLAHKKVPFIDVSGQLVQPKQPNAIKFEKFIFDLLPRANCSIVVEVDPAEAFSPVKNAASESTSTVLTAQQAMTDQARRAIRRLGQEIDEAIDVEISPALLADPVTLKQRVNELSPIREPVYLE